MSGEVECSSIITLEMSSLLRKPALGVTPIMLESVEPDLLSFFRNKWAVFDPLSLESLEHDFSRYLDSLGVFFPLLAETETSLFLNKLEVFDPLYLLLLSVRSVFDGIH